MCVLVGGVHRADASATSVPPRPLGAPTLDEVGVLSATAKEELAALHGRLVAERDGAEIGVLVVKTLNGDDPRSFATEVYNAWGLGRASKDNGAILMVSIDDHKVELVLGDGVDDDAGIAASRTIVSEHLVPAFKRGDVEGGIIDGAERTASKIFGLARTVIAVEPTAIAGAEGTGTPQSTASAPENTLFSGKPFDMPESPYFDRNVLIFILIFALATASVGAAMAIGRFGPPAVVSFRRKRPRACPTCHKPMVRLGEQDDDAKLDSGQRTEERIGSVDYDVWACGACNTALVRAHENRGTAYASCPQCGAHTKSAESTTLRSPTTTSSGDARIDERCANCSFTRTFTTSIPPIWTSTSSSSSNDFGSSNSLGSSSGFGSGSSSFGSSSSGSSDSGHSSGGGSSGSW